MSHYEVIALALLTFHGPTGASIDLNANAVTHFRDPHEMPKGHWAEGTHCIIFVDGEGTIAVRETCDEVRKMVLKPTGPCALVCGDSSRQ